MFEDPFDGFFEVLLLEFDRQAAYKLFLLLKIESLPQLSVLLYVVVDLPGEFLVEPVLLG